MIGEIRIAGLKAIGPEVRVPLRPITLIFGHNSAGKSTILQAIMAVTQSWTTLPGINRLETHGSRVDLGRFGRALHRRGNARSDAVEISFIRAFDSESDAPDVTLRWTAPGSPNAVSGELESIVVSTSWGPVKFWCRDEGEGVVLALHSDTVGRWCAQGPEYKSLLASLTDFGTTLEWVLLPGAPPARRLGRLIVGDDEYRSNERGEPLTEEMRTLVLTVRESTIQELEDLFLDRSNSDEPSNHAVTPWRVADGAIDRLLSWRQTLLNAVHVGPLRVRGGRSFLVRHVSEPRIGHAGEDLGPVLSEEAWWGTESLQETNRLLECAQLAVRVSLRDVEGVQDPLRELVLTTTDSTQAGEERGLPDVGSGISQILPVLAQMAVSRVACRHSESVVLIEQPELHLHPLAQSRLGEALLAAIDVDAEGRASPLQLIIETHSEHLVLGLCNLVADGKLDREQVSIVCCERGEDGLRVTPIGLDASGGFLDAWPGGFFPERRTLLSGRTP